MPALSERPGQLKASQEVPRHCKDCGLCDVAQTYKMFPEVDQRAESQRMPRVLVLISQPHHDDDKTGVPLYGRQSGGVFLRDYLNLGKFRWYLSSMVRCAPPKKMDGSKRKASAKEIRACVENELPALLDQIRPEVVILLGEPTMRGVLGISAPRSLFRATGGTFSIVHGDRLIPVLVQEDPLCHVMWQEKVEGGKDLAEKYERLFEKAQKIAVEGAKTEGYDYTLIDTPQKLARLSRDLGAIITMDWEYAANELLPGARTMWHLQSHGICVAVTDISPEGTVRNFVVLPELCRRGDLWADILRGRMWRGQNLKTEFQAFWIYSGLDVYSLVDPSLKLHGEYQIHDTMLWAFAQDHGRMGVGLKPQCMDLLKVDDWSLGMDKDLEEAAARLALEHKEARKNIKKIHQLWLMPELDAESKKVLWGQKQQLLAQYRQMRPEKSIHFGDARSSTTFEYNAGDTQNNHFLAEKQIEMGWAPAEPLAELLQRALFVTTMVEREGLPVDPERFATLQKATRRKYLHYTRQLLRFKAVRQTLKNDKNILMAKAGGLLDRQCLYQQMSPKRTTFLHELARRTGVFDRIPRSKKVNKKTGELGYKLDEDVLLDLSGGEEDTKEQHKKPTWTPSEDKSEVQQIWTYIYALRQLFDLQNNFIKNMEWYTVDRHVRPDFRLAKVDSDVKGEAGGTSTGRLACLAEGTLIQAPCDREKYPNGIPIEKVLKGDWLYSYDSAGKLSLRQALWAGKTGTRETVRLAWRGSGHKHTGELLLTPEHLVRRLDGVWVRADELAPGDRVMALSQGIGPYGYSRLWAYGGQELREHRWAAEQLGMVENGSKLHVHHKDERQLNNHPDNYEILTPVEHNRRHLPDREALQQRARHLHTPEAKSRQLAQIKSGEENSRYLHIGRLTLLRALAWAGGNLRECSRQQGWSYPTLRSRCEKYGIAYKELSKRYDGDGNFLSRGRVRRALDAQHTYRNNNQIQEVLKIGYYRVKEICEYYELDHYNHEILSVTPGPTVPVYDITMDGEPCFIANEIAVHNSTAINSQNIKKDPFLRWIFSAGVYGADWFCFDADYDRIEPVCLTQVAKIASWVKVFNNGWDLYKVIANQIYHLGISMEGTVAEVHARLEDKVTGVPKELRENAKTRTLAIMYGESPRAFAARANIPLEEAVAFFKEFDRLYPEIKQYKKNIEWLVKAGELVYSPFGRPRMFTPKINRSHPRYHKDLTDALLQAYNFPIQSMASDITLWKAYEIYRFLEKRGLLDRVKMINLIHDSVCFVAHRSVGALAMREIKRILEDTSTLPLEDFSTPMRCGFKIGLHHGYMSEVENVLTKSDYQAKVTELFDNRKQHDWFKPEKKAA